MFARFDENPAMTLQAIKETKRYGRTDGHTDARTDNVKTVYPLQTKFAGGIKTASQNHVRTSKLFMALVLWDKWTLKQISSPVFDRKHRL